MSVCFCIFFIFFYHYYTIVIYSPAMPALVHIKKQFNFGRPL